MARSSNCRSRLQRFGTVPDPDWMRRKYHRDWQGYDTVNTSIGQGICADQPAAAGGHAAARVASGRHIVPRLQRTRGEPNFAPDRRPTRASRVRPQGDGRRRQRARHRRRVEASARRYADGRQDGDRPGLPASASAAHQSNWALSRPRAVHCLRAGGRAALSPSAASSNMAASAPRPPRRSCATA